MGTPVYITHDTFTGNSCSNGAALSGLYANFDVINSVMTGNKAIGWGANPASSGAPGGGSGGAIYTDGDHYSLTIDRTVISGNSAREGGGAVFFVVDAGGGTLNIDYSTLHRNPSGEFQNAPGIFDSVNGHVTRPVVIDSKIS
jgi:predicted outer membrane repeat protein